VLERPSLTFYNPHAIPQYLLVLFYCHIDFYIVFFIALCTVRFDTWLFNKQIYIIIIIAII